MTTAIDTNILIALWDVDDNLNVLAQTALDRAYEQGNLVIFAPVYAELLVGQGRSTAMVDGFLSDTGIIVDWVAGEDLWRQAAVAYQGYVNRRRRQKQHEPKRLLTDFLIGAHASVRGHSLVTLDKRIFRAAFPNLKILEVK